jgi:hypothetical protein
MTTTKPPARFPDLAYLDGLSLTEVAREAADLTAQAKAFMGAVARARRDAIRAAVDGPGLHPRLRRERVEAVAAELGVSIQAVYQALRRD